MLKTLRMLQNDWQRLYRHHGGLNALLRCWRGTGRLTSSNLTPVEESLPGVDCITFSVVPKMTAFWANWIRSAINESPLRVYIGDCSGTLEQYLPGDEVVRVLPLLNYHHGEKLDLFVKHLCRTDYVIITDDDIFWLDTIPWHWALEQFQRDPQVAVVSLLPFKHMLAVLRDKVPFPMGSCLIIRRKIWMDENLSFRVDYSPISEGKWIYDTGAKAQVQLVDRGYKIVYAPDEVQIHFEAFEGMSSWMLKIQKQEGNILDNISGDTNVRPAKAFRAILAAKSMAELIIQFSWGKLNPDLIVRPLLDRAEAVCTSVLSPAEVDAAHEESQAKFQRLQASLNARQ